MSIHQFCTFYIDQHLFGIEAVVVQEVILNQQLTPVPLAPNDVLGVINLRGQIITAIDLRKRLGFESANGAATSVSVVALVQEELVSFMVERIGEIVEIDLNDLEAIPDTLQGAARELLNGAYKMPGQILLILDPQKMANVPDTTSRTIMNVPSNNSSREIPRRDR
jgi:purine-binding chemotaxis protein CheW